tara:strand:+ start:6948 stop:8987 length:2040 start_codon:yes stop_codon:yes gene_type:complete
MKNLLKFGGAGVILINENYTYDTALTEFLENSTWSILDNSTLTSMVLICNANSDYKVPFTSSRANSFLFPIKSIAIKLMICSNKKKNIILNLPVQLRSRGNKGTGKFASKILISSESSVIKEASIQNDICFKSSTSSNTLLNGLCPCILGIKQLKYDDVFLDNIKDNNYIQEWYNIANNSNNQTLFNENDFDNESDSELPNKEDKSLFIPIQKISELGNKMKQNINKRLVQFINERYEEEFINFLYILNFAKFEYPDNELSLCILGMEFIDDFETFYSFLENAKNSAKLNATSTVRLKNEYDYGVSQINKSSAMEEYGVSSSEYNKEIKENEEFNNSLYNMYYDNLLRKQLTHLPKCILWAMVSLHSHGYIHGDFHKNNVYVKIKDNKNITDTNLHSLNDVIIIDFGKTKKINSSHQNMINNYNMEQHLPLLNNIISSEKITFLQKYPFFSQFIISHIRLEYDPEKQGVGFKNYVDLLVELIIYYESIGIKNSSGAPSEMVDSMMTSNFLSPPDGKNNQLSIIEYDSENRNEFNEFVNDIIEKYKHSKPSFSSFQDDNKINDSMEYDADGSIEMSVSNSQSGGKTTLFKNNFIPSVPKINVKKLPSKSFTKNKSNFDVDLLIKQFEERHLRPEFHDKNYKIPVWNLSKSSLSSKYRKTRKNSKSKSKKSKSLKNSKSKK